MTPTEPVNDFACMQCISRWSLSQLEAKSTLSTLACPLCKQPYHSIFTDLSSNYFRYAWAQLCSCPPWASGADLAHQVPWQHCRMHASSDEP